MVSNALPTLYSVDEESHVAEPVMIPIASTVIPLEDLPGKIYIFKFIEHNPILIICFVFEIKFSKLDLASDLILTIKMIRM